jgi:hypothetical protein
MKGPKRNNPPGPSAAVAIAKKPEGGRGPRKNPPPNVKENASEAPQSDAAPNTKDVKDDVNVAGGKPNVGSKKDRFPPRSGGKGTKDVPGKKDPSADVSFKAVAAPPPPPPPPPKKSFKLVVRKLPPTKDYTKEIFEQNLHAVLNTLTTAGTPSSTTWMSDVHVDHFIEGKISRKRGPVNGAGFIAFTDESLFQLFKTQCPATIPFLADENNCQPEITPALYIKTFRQKEKVDVKYGNTYLEDPEFIAFQERASKPDSVLKAEAIAALAEKDKLREASAVAAAAAASAAASSGSGTNKIANLLQNNALLRFLREKSLAKSRRRHAAADVARGTGASNVSDKKKSRKEKKKEKGASGDRDSAKAGMSRAEKDKERSLKRKEIRKQKNEQAIVAEAMALMSASSDASKPLEEFIKDVKRSHKKKKKRVGADNVTVASADTAETSTTKPKRKAKAAKSSPMSTTTTKTKLSRREKDEARRAAAKAAGASGLALGSAVPTPSPELRILQRDKGATSSATATTTQGNQKTNPPAVASTV